MLKQQDRILKNLQIKSALAQLKGWGNSLKMNIKYNKIQINL